MSITLLSNPHQYHVYENMQWTNKLTLTHTDFAFRHFQQVDAKDWTLSAAHIILGVAECIPVLGILIGTIERIAFSFLFPLTKQIKLKCLAGMLSIINNEKSVLPGFLWVKVKAAAMEINRCLKISSISKSTCHGFNLLNFRI